MNFFQHSLVDYCFEKVSAASRILRNHSALREGIPDAWVYALMQLNCAFHVPPAAQADFTFLCDVMSRSLWVGEDGRVTFNPLIPNEDLGIIEAAYRRTHLAIVNVVLDSLRHMMNTASAGNAAKEIALLNTVLDDSNFWDVGERIEGMTPQDPDESPPAATFWYHQRLIEWAPTGPAH